MELTERVKSWQQAGEITKFRGHSIHTFRQPGEGLLLLLLHGFPSSSYDWRLLLEEERRRNVLAFDFLGFGLSDKPRDHDYSLFWQADLTEELVRRHGGGRAVFVLAHDMGTSVANELMARDIEGRLEMELAGIMLFNGSMVLERPLRPRPSGLLRSRFGPLLAKLSSERLFRHQFGSVFSAEPPAERRGGRRPVVAGLPQRRPHPRPSPDLLHGPARNLRRALARRDPRLARRPQPRLGHARPGGQRPTCWRPCASSAPPSR